MSDFMVSNAELLTEWIVYVPGLVSEPFEKPTDIEPARSAVLAV